MPASLKTWIRLGLPLEMIDEPVYADIAKRILTEAQEQAKEHSFKELGVQLGLAIQKTKSIVGGADAKKKRDRDITEGDLIEILKKPNFISELDELDPTKIKKDVLREKVATYLSKRQPKQTAVEPKDDWEKTFTSFFRDEYLKSE